MSPAPTLTKERKTEINDGMNDLPFNSKELDPYSLGEQPFMSTPIGEMFNNGILTIAKFVGAGMALWLIGWYALDVYHDYAKANQYTWESYLPEGQERLAKAKMRVCEDKIICPHGPSDAVKMVITGNKLPEPAPAAVPDAGYNQPYTDKPNSTVVVEIPAQPVKSL